MATVRRSDLRRALAQLVEHTSKLHVEFDQLLEAIDQSCGIGYPSSTLGSGGGRSSDTSSMVERQAFGRDQALTDRQRVEQLVAWCATSMAEVDELRKRYTAPPRKGRATRRGHADDGCEMMATVGEYEPGRLTDADGILPHKRRLGRWARDFVIRTGRLPVREEVERHARGARVLT